MRDQGLCAPGYVENVLADALGIELLGEEPIEIAPRGGVRLLLVPTTAVDEVVRELGELGLGELEVLDERARGIADVEVFQAGDVQELRRSRTASRRR